MSARVAGTDAFSRQGERPPAEASKFWNAKSRNHLLRDTPEIRHYSFTGRFPRQEIFTSAAAVVCTIGNICSDYVGAAWPEFSII
jgi:hypothetical protein